MDHSEPLKVCTCNVRGIRNKSEIFYNFLSDNGIGLSLVTETNLVNDIRLRHNVKYQLIRLDRDTSRQSTGRNPGGGVAVACDRRIGPPKLLPLIELEVIEAITFELKLRSRTIVFIVVYYPGTGNVEAFRRDIVKLTTAYKNYVI